MGNRSKQKLISSKKICKNKSISVDSLGCFSSGMYRSATPPLLMSRIFHASCVRCVSFCLSCLYPASFFCLCRLQVYSYEPSNPKGHVIRRFGYARLLPCLSRSQRPTDPGLQALGRVMTFDKTVLITPLISGQNGAMGVESHILKIACPCPDQEDQEERTSERNLYLRRLRR
jgi:hypothetical protein